MCEQISPISPEKCPPHIPGCEQTIKDIAYNRAHELYGDHCQKLYKQGLIKSWTQLYEMDFPLCILLHKS